MKKVIQSLHFTLAISVCIISSVISPLGKDHVQPANTINGYVFGQQRQPLSDITVELLDDYSRSIARTRTNASGRYSFTGMKSGRYKVRAMPLGSDYEEQEQEIEIQNISREVNGSIFTSASDNVQKDFYLKVRKSMQVTGRTDSIFIQEVPQSAQDTYKRGIQLLDEKKETEGLKEIKTSIEIFPNYYDALERLGSEYVRLKHYLPAQILLAKAIEVNPRGFKSWYGLAYALYSQNKPAEALEAVLKANSLNQNSIESLMLAGVLLKHDGKFSEAEKPLKRAKELSKNSLPEINWQLALLYGNNLKRYREAAEELEQFLKARPDVKDAENIKKLIAQFKEKAGK